MTASPSITRSCAPRPITGPHRPERRAAHLALATALSASTHRSRRAWHLAAAATGPDDETADELEAIAADARGSGAPVAAGRAGEAAARLTVDLGQRVERLLLAAEDYLLGAAVEAMVAVLDEALALAGDDALTRARAEHLRHRGTVLQGAPLESAARLRAEAERVAPAPSGAGRSDVGRRRRAARDGWRTLRGAASAAGTRVDQAGGRATRHV